MFLLLSNHEVLGLDELVVRDLDAYEAAMVRLATDGLWYDRLVTRLEERPPALWDSSAYADRFVDALHRVNPLFFYSVLFNCFS